MGEIFVMNKSPKNHDYRHKPSKSTIDFHLVRFYVVFSCCFATYSYLVVFAAYKVCSYAPNCLWKTNPGDQHPKNILPRGICWWSVSVTYWYVKTPKLSGLKQDYFFFLRFCGVGIWVGFSFTLLMPQLVLAVITYSDTFYLESSLTRFSCSLGIYFLIFIFYVTAGVCPFSNLQEKFPHCIPIPLAISSLVLRLLPSFLQSH